jgi:hypothetical protein
MTYDLRRLRLAGLIRRIEHANQYVLTPDGVKVAVFYTKLRNRLLRPLLAADQPQGTDGNQPGITGSRPTARNPSSRALSRSAPAP